MDGGTTSGYSLIGSVNSAIAPPIVMKAEMTAAKIGRSMKKWESFTGVPYGVERARPQLRRCAAAVGLFRASLLGAGSLVELVAELAVSAFVAGWVCGVLERGAFVAACVCVMLEWGAFGSPALVGVGLPASPEGGCAVFAASVELRANIVSGFAPCCRSPIATRSGVTVAPGRTRCRPLTTMVSPGDRPFATTRRPSMIGPSFTGRYCTLLSAPTTST